MRLDDLHKATPVIGIVQRAVEQSFRVAPDGGQRGAQFVRNIGHEILAYAFQALQIGDVIQNGHGPATRSAGQRSRLYFK